MHGPRLACIYRVMDACGKFGGARDKPNVYLAFQMLSQLPKCIHNSTDEASRKKWSIEYCHFIQYLPGPGCWKVGSR